MAHNHSNQTKDNATKNIVVAFFLNLGFAVIELIGGLYTNSVAILSDALHDFGDSISLAVSWVLQKKSNKGRDAKYSYGYKRFSLLGAIFISIVLVVGSTIIIKESVERILDPQSVNAKGMMYLAIVGIVVNGFAVIRLNKGKSFNERAVFLHMMEDVLGWIAVLIVSIVMQFVDVPVLDPLLSIGVCIWVLSNVYKNLKGTLKVMLQGTPQDVDLSGYENKVKALPQVNSLHDVHLWSLDGEHNILTLHVVTTDDITANDMQFLKEQIRQISSSYNIPHVTIEFDNNGSDCEYLDKD